MSKEYRVAVAGATGAVGRAMRSILAERDFPVKELVALATAKSAGMHLDYRGEEVICQELTPESFRGIDLALFSAGGGTSLKYAPMAREAGCVVVDNSSAWRMEPDVPLVVPEVNPDDVNWHKGIIANPNCSTIQMVVVMKPLHDEAKITRVVVSTYQAVSGTGAKAINELMQQTGRLLAGDAPEINVYPHQIAFNCLPQIDVFLEDGYTKEEQKMVDETKKIMGDNSIAVSATCVRVPVQNGHSEAINLQFARPLSVERARELLAEAPGVKVVDDPANKVYPMPIEASGQDDTYVGRIRRDPTAENALNLWVVADNLRKGAALNAVQIAELLVQRDLIRVPR
ncbi:MAG: aspartate-semialdehyde dehydrogenase [Actinobacteria bacterium RBG_16_64_13]|nr:MAG: aspartate-semialdehyde dehydrogenase [Actinobacteria bacterium RBG_16_64_13]